MILRQYWHHLMNTLQIPIPISVAIQDIFGKEPVYLVDENPKRLIERFVEVLIEKQETIAAEGLKQHPFSDAFR